MSERDYASEVETSEVAFKILGQLNHREGLSPSRIAQNTGSTQTSISNYLKGLRERGLVSRMEKQGRSQPYKIDYNGFIEVFKDLWHQKRSRLTESDRSPIDTMEKFLGDDFPEDDKAYLLELCRKHDQSSEKFESNFLDLNDKQEEIIISYCKYYIDSSSDSNLSKMLVTDFGHTLANLNPDSLCEDGLKLFEELYMVIWLATQIGVSIRSMEKSLSDKNEIK